MNNINQFSIRRMMQLVKMELKIEGRSMLILSAAVIGGIVLLTLLAGYGRATFALDSVLAGFEMLIIIVMWIFLCYFVFMMNKRIRSSNTIAYSSIPSSTMERFLSILLLGIIHFLLAWLVAQVSMSILLLLNSSARMAMINNPNSLNLVAAVGSFHYYSIIAFSEILKSPGVWLLLTIMLYVIVSSQAAFGWNANTWWEKLMFVALVVIITLPIWYGDTCPKLLSLSPILLWVLSAGLFVGSYFRLKFIEQR